MTVTSETACISVRVLLVSELGYIFMNLVEKQAVRIMEVYCQILLFASNVHEFCNQFFRQIAERGHAGDQKMQRTETDGDKRPDCTKQQCQAEN